MGVGCSSVVVDVVAAAAAVVSLVLRPRQRIIDDVGAIRKVD